MAETVFNLAPHRNIRNRRGQPIIFLGVIVGVWILGRFMSYAPDVDSADMRPTSQGYTKAEISGARMPFLTDKEEEADYSQDWQYSPLSSQRIAKLTPYIKSNTRSTWLVSQNLEPFSRQVSAQPENGFPPVYSPTDSSPDKLTTLSPKPASPPVSDMQKPVQNQNNWSLQNWILVRAGGVNTIAAGNGQYGGSQIGGVLRYTLKPGDRRRAELYARFSTALSSNSNDRFDDAEMALGFSARPAKTIPVAVAVEQRIAIGKNARTRPAIYAATQIPPFDLPAKTRGSFYAQAGAVGIKDTQYFYDTQLVIDKHVAAISKIKISAGGGVWSGGQTGQNNQEPDIYRVDVGPRVSAAVPLGASNARLSLDYRARIAGNAEPGSGLAITLSTDF